MFSNCLDVPILLYASYKAFSNTFFYGLFKEVGHNIQGSLRGRGSAKVSQILVIYCVLSWHEWKRAGGLHGDFTHDAILSYLALPNMYIIFKRL